MKITARAPHDQIDYHTCLLAYGRSVPILSLVSGRTEFLGARERCWLGDWSWSGITGQSSPSAEEKMFMAEKDSTFTSTLRRAHAGDQPDANRSRVAGRIKMSGSPRTRAAAACGSPFAVGTMPEM